MNKLFLLTICLSFMCSCNWNKNGINVKIKNSSDTDVHDIIFSTNDPKINLKFRNIKPGETIEEFLDMTSNVKGDGNYLISFKRGSGKIEKMSGGYYTNGGSLNYMVLCEVKNDTILMTFR